MPFSFWLAFYSDRLNICRKTSLQDSSLHFPVITVILSANIFVVKSYKVFVHIPLIKIQVFTSSLLIVSFKMMALMATFYAEVEVWKLPVLPKPSLVIHSLSRPG